MQKIGHPWSKRLLKLIYTARTKNKNHTLAFCKRPPFTLIMECICCGICFWQHYAMPQHLFPLHELPRFCIDDRRVEPFLQSFPLTPNTFKGVKVRTLWWPIHVWKWLLMLPDTHVSSCSTLSQSEPDESWHCCPGICLSHQGRKKLIDGKTCHSVHSDHNKNISWFKLKLLLFFGQAVYKWTEANLT